MSYNVLWVDDDERLLASAETACRTICKLRTAHSLEEGRQILRKDTPELLLLDIEIGRDNGLEALQEVKKAHPQLDVVMVSGERDSKQIVSAIRAGAADFLTKPFNPEEIVAIIEKMRILKTLRDRHDALVANLNPPTTKRRFVGSSPAFRAMLADADRLKGHQANILIQGESGTGKELLARHIHNLECDPRRPFIAVNCAAIPEGLLESELFGHEKGAFTGATQRRIGKFELASGGDIFLDEISSLRPDLQVKILRVIQEKEVVRVGGNQPIAVDFRVLSATNENLLQLAEKRLFRIDLFHRLRVIEIAVPPLRERKEDIPTLISYFLDKFAKTSGQKRITTGALRCLQEYAWPGNVRELENVVHSLLILSPDEIIDEHSLPVWVGEPDAEPLGETRVAFPNVDWTSPGTLPGLRDFTRAAEREFITHVLQIHQGDKSAAAQTLNVGRTTLYSKLKELGLMR